jgi:hypothetical protein
MLVVLGVDGGVGAEQDPGGVYETYNLGSDAGKIISTTSVAYCLRKI